MLPVIAAALMALNAMKPIELVVRAVTSALGEPSLKVTLINRGVAQRLVCYPGEADRVLWVQSPRLRKRDYGALTDAGFWPLEPGKSISATVPLSRLVNLALAPDGRHTFSLTYDDSVIEKYAQPGAYYKVGPLTSGLFECTIKDHKPSDLRRAPRYITRSPGQPVQL